MEKTRIVVTKSTIDAYDGDMIIFGAVSNGKKLPLCDDAVKQLVKQGFEQGDFFGKSGEKILVYPSDNRSVSGFHAKRLLVVGIGKQKDLGSVEKAGEAFRKAGGNIAKVCEKVKAQKIMIPLPDTPFLDPGQTARCLCEGVMLGDYRFEKYKKKKEDKAEYPGIKEVKVFTRKAEKKVRTGVKLGVTSARAVCVARDMGNEPGNGWRPLDFEAYAGQLARTYGFKFKCLNKKDMEKLGMGGLLAVNQGSKEPPKMIILEYRPAKKSETLLLVGKGITFDSGGISIKPSQGMEEMKYDMCGGAAVLSAMQAVGEEKPGVGVVAVVPATDNMSGASAVKPGDVIRHYNGVTAEIVNTDAEGRMVLADALAYGIEKYQPDYVVDIATLTGAVIIGLGHHYAGLLSNNDSLVQRLESASKRAGEPLWRLPLGKEYSKQIESPTADIKNMGGKPAGTITAAAYLQNFVGDTPWAHLDIAGTAWGFTKKTYVPKGVSGFGVRLFIELIRQWKQK